MIPMSLSTCLYIEHYFQLKTNIFSFSDYDLYLLVGHDLPYEREPMRSSREERVILSKKFRQAIEEQDLAYASISGLGDERLQNAVKAIRSYKK